MIIPGNPPGDLQLVPLVALIALARTSDVLPLGTHSTWARPVQWPRLFRKEIWDHDRWHRRRIIM